MGTVPRVHSTPDRVKPNEDMEKKSWIAREEKREESDEKEKEKRGRVKEEGKWVERQKRYRKDSKVRENNRGELGGRERG